MHPLYSIRVSKVTNFASNAYSPDLDVMPNTVDNSIHPCLYTASQNLVESMRIELIQNCLQSSRLPQQSHSPNNNTPADHHDLLESGSSLRPFYTVWIVTAEDSNLSQEPLRSYHLSTFRTVGRSVGVLSQQLI
jgi:hypothetical protein